MSDGSNEYLANAELNKDHNKKFTIEDCEKEIKYLKK